MDKFKEFEGKNLDEAISDACGYFGCPREKLEIDILKDAKSGIFGLVGARKAKIRARRAQLDDVMESILGRKNQGDEIKKPEAAPEKQIPETRAALEENAQAPSLPAKARENMPARRKEQAATIPAKKGEKAEQKGQGGKGRMRETVTKDGERKREKAGEEAQEAAREAPGEKREASPKVENMRPGKKMTSVTSPKAEARRDKRHSSRHGRPAESGYEDRAEDQGEQDSVSDGLPLTPVEELDAELLEKTVREVVSRLVAPIACRETPVTVELGSRRVRARVEWQGDAGLLIGREGMTLIALQYLASRIVSRIMNAALRVQLDIGDYRRNQDDKLRETARFLADKALQTGRSYATRPLSSYHRRIIHLALQAEPNVHTRSSGEGPMKRVVISPRKGAAENQECRS